MITTALPTINIKEAALAARVSEQTVRRWMKTGVLRAVKIGGRYRTTMEWIRDLSTPVATRDEVSSGGNTKNDGYEIAAHNLRAKFSLSVKKVSRC